MKLSSSAFEHNAPIPAKYTCEGEDLSPPLAWSEVPAETKSLALMIEDPDAPDPSNPTMIWVHWVLHNLPRESTGLEEGVRHLPHGTLQGANDWKRTAYGGPCPPAGRHRYIHTLYALNVVLPDLRHPTRCKLEAAMRRHVIDEAVLVGTYQKHGKRGLR
jgi:Raf kinase inhibitor-like YbhB/YbcL family protein